MNTIYPYLEFPSNIPFQIEFQQLRSLHKHWHATVELLFVLHGQVTAQVQETVSYLSEGDLLLINSNHIHELYSRDSSLIITVQLDMHKFDLPPEEADQLYFLCDSSRDTDQSRFDNLRSLIALIIEHNTTQDAATRYENKSFAYSVLQELTRNFQGPPPASLPVHDSQMERMNDIVNYIDSHYREDIRLGQLAQAVHLSPPYLSSLFTRYLGATFSEYYNSVRLDHAVNDLVTTELSIEEIAVRNGYSNAPAFGRAFRAKYHELPSAYRKSHRQINFNGMRGDRWASLLLSEYSNSVFDISALAQYLPRQEGSVSAGKDLSAILVRAAWGQVTGALPMGWRKLVGIGSAKQILYREVQEQMEEVQQQIGFEYIRFHGLFSDEMMVVNRTAAGALEFNFKTIDIVFDYLFSIGLKPFLQLSFMPIELAADRQKMIFNNHYNTSPPARLEEWVDLVRAFFNHIVSRYGRKVVEELPVTLWNNADSPAEMFGMQDDLDFFHLYRETYWAIKEIDERIQVGGPPVTFMSEESTQWTRRFYQWEREHDVVPDFFCTQAYSVILHPSQLKIDLHSWKPDHLVSTRENALFPLMAGIPLSTDADHLRTFRDFLDQFLAELGLDELPIWVTEWNLSISHNMLINDTMFGGCYVVKNILENSSGLEALGYWCVTDFIEEQPLVDDAFHGGLGLMTAEGIRKPAFLAYQTLAQMEPQVLSRGEGFTVSRSENTLTILLYNYEHFNDIFAGNKTYNVNRTVRYTPFTEQKRQPFRLRVAGLPDREVLEAVEFIVNREHGSAYDHWIKMGAPDGGADLSLDRYRLQLLKAAAHPLVHSFRPNLRNGTFRYDVTLNPLEFRLIQIKFR